jgi:hypothetical protein
LLAVLIVVEIAQLGVGVWAQLHRRAHKNPFGPLG